MNGIQEVSGSIPLISTINKTARQTPCGFLISKSPCFLLVFTYIFFGIKSLLTNRCCLANNIHRALHFAVSVGLLHLLRRMPPLPKWVLCTLCDLLNRLTDFCQAVLLFLRRTMYIRSLRMRSILRDSLVWFLWLLSILVFGYP